jgi:DNA topoisomerase-1
MRTDSFNLSDQAIGAAATYIKSAFGDNYSNTRKFKTKNASAQEAHEAIRPTDMSLEVASGDSYDQKLYDLIRRRTLASQMAAAKLEKTTVTITVSSRKELFEAKGEVVLFDGYMKVYGGGKKEPDILPAMSSGDILKLNEAIARQTFARPPARYTEGSLVKKLEELGIGRPSTYATIIDTIQTRGYVERGEGEGTERDVVVLSFASADPGSNSFSEDSALLAERGKTSQPLAPSESSEKDVDDAGGLPSNSRYVRREIIQEKTGADRGKLVPTPSGELIADFLSDHFEQVVDYGFTAGVEGYFDEIANGKLGRNVMLADFYGPFHELIEQSGGIDRSTVGTNRELGNDPKSGKPIIARFGRFGPMLQLGATEDKDNKPQFAPLPAGTRLDTITLEEALRAFTLPRVVGQTPDGKDIKANIGRFGPYIQIDKLYVSIKPEDPHTITLETALELFNAKLKAEAEKNITDFGDGIKVLNGRFGPYITDGKKNAKIPKDVEPKAITHDEAKKLLDEAPAAKKRGFPKRTPRKK